MSIRNPPVPLAVALGSGLGGVARLLLGEAVSAVTTTTIPLGVLTVNILGCLAIGLLAALLPGGLSRQFWLAGFCGGFTTFSLFSLETLWLLQRHGPGPALVYSLLTLVGSIGAVFLGWNIAGRIDSRMAPALTPETPRDQESD